MSENNAKKPLQSIKSTVLGRTLSLAKLSLSAGTQLASHGVAGLFQDPESKQNQWQSFLNTQASALTKELGELKGSLMKAGQMLSMYGEHFFPPEVNQLFKTLQQDSPPLAWDSISEIIRRELSDDLLQELEIHQTALACASMGQVHRAKIKKTGQEIVLKIQYPNVDKAIDSDLKSIKTFLNIAKILPQNVNFDPVFEEIRSMLVLETDYENEIKMTKKYKKLIGEDSRYVIPDIIDRYSTKKIIASTFIKGLRVDDPLIKNLSQERRNKLSSHFLDLYFRELFEWHFIQTDPHIGNYQIQIDPQGNDKLVLFDFGATKQYSSDFMTNYGSMIRSSLNNDRKALHEASLKLKFLDVGDSSQLKKEFENFCLETVEPFLQKTDPRAAGKLDSSGFYDWKNTDLPQRLSKMVMQIIKNNSPWRTPPQEILFIDRKTGGVFIFLSVLGAKMNSFEIIDKRLPRQT